MIIMLISNAYDNVSNSVMMIIILITIISHDNAVVSLWQNW